VSDIRGTHPLASSSAEGVVRHKVLRDTDAPRRHLIHLILEVGKS
jgi:hypothetical protein